MWFPFQVCFEYQRNRLSVIKNSLIDFNNIESDLNKIIQILGSLCGEKLGFQGKYENLHSDLCILRDDIKKEINKFITEKIKLKSAENDYISKSDEVRKWIEVLSENRIGKPLTQEQVDKINKIGERRYKYKVGPGWGDDNKKQEYFFNGVFYSAKYGDLYIWNEILNKSESEDVSSIVFITNDEKSDWWYKIEINVMMHMDLWKY
ncbi:PIN-like domain-containing protein [Providencia rettgeri]